jgi:homoserine O-acetyltransferase
MARSAGPDPVDWVYKSRAYDAHDVGTTPGFDGDTAAANATLVRLAGNAGHAVAADTSPQLVDVHRATSEFLAGHAG